MSNYRILDTYTSYKIKESKWTRWLVETAEKAGHNIRDNININRKNVGTSSASHVVSIKDLASLAKSIVTGDPPQPVPETIRHLLQDVISQRKEASVFYRTRSNEETITKSDEGHLYYVKVLEDVLKTLIKGAKSQPSLRASLSDTAEAEETYRLSNVFEILADRGHNNVQDDVDEEENDNKPEESSDKENSKARKPRKNAKKSKKQSGKAKKTPKSKNSTIANPITELDMFSPQNSYAISEDEEEELFFCIYCFFKDFNDIRAWLQERWCDYQDGLCSLIEVSVVVNTAFDVFQKSEQALLKLYPRLEFEEIANLLFFNGGLLHVDYERLNHGNLSKEQQGDAFAEEWDWLCLDTYHDLKEWLENVPPKKVPTGKWHTPGPTPTDVPNYQAQTGKEKILRDKGIIFEFLAECCFIKGLELRKSFFIPAEDELTRGSIKLLHRRKIPMWLVFAFKVYCDIRVILESEVANGREDLLAVGERCKLRLNDYLEYTEHQHLDLVPRSFIKERVAEIDCWITRDWAEPDRTELHSRHGESKEDIEPFFFHRRNPIMCGLVGFANKLMMNEVGLDVASKGGAIIATTHIYNAVRQEVPSFPVWQDVQAVVLIHGQARIFWDGIPKTPTGYLKSYNLSTGIEGMIASLRREPLLASMFITPRDVYQRGLEPASVVSWIFHERYCYGRKSLDDSVKTLPDVEKVLNHMAQNEMQVQLEGFRRLALPSTMLDQGRRRAIADREQISNSISSSLTRQFQKSRALTSLQLLDALWGRMSQESMTLAFDYFSMHQRCTTLLRSINEEFKEDIKEVVGFEVEEDGGQLPVVAYAIFKMLKEEGSWGSKSQVAERLAKVMKPIVDEEGNAEILAVRSEAIGNAIKSV